MKFWAAFLSCLMLTFFSKREHCGQGRRPKQIQIVNIMLTAGRLFLKKAFDQAVKDAYDQVAGKNFSGEYSYQADVYQKVTENHKKTSAGLFRNYQIKHFTLKVYPSSVADRRKILTVSAEISGCAENKLSAVLNRKADSVPFAEAVACF